MFEPSILTLCCIGAMLWLIASPLERGTPVPAKLVVLHLAGDTDAGYFTNFVSCCTIRVHSGLLRPLMAHLTENFEAPSNFSQSQQAALDVANVLGEAAAALADSEMLPASALGGPPGSPRHQVSEAGRKGQWTGLPAKGLTDNPAQSSSSDMNPGQQQNPPRASGTERERLEQAAAPEGLGQLGPRDGLAPEPGGKGAPAAGRDPARACSPPRENVFEAGRRAFTGSNRARLLAYLPLNVETDPASTNMLLLEKKEKGEVDSSLRLVLFLGLVRQCIKQITTRMEQPEDLEQLATLKFLRKKDGGTKMEWPYTPTPALDHTELMTPLAKVLAEKFPPPTADYPRQPRKPQTGRPSPGRENAPKHSAGLIMKEGDQQSDLDPVQGMLQALLRLHLHNPRNLCYAYATLHIYDRQQDAVEFLGFLLEYAQPPAYTGSPDALLST
eukprot:s6460_g1.t1